VKKTAIDELNSLLDLIKMINSMNQTLVEEEIFNGQVHTIGSIYKSLDAVEKKKLWNLISLNIGSDPQMHVFLLSIILVATEDEIVLEQIVKVILEGKLTLDQSIFAHVQVSRFNFLHPKSGNRYELRRYLHKSLLERFKEELGLQYEYRRLAERNSNRIVVVTGTILSVSHAPTKLVLQYCYKLQKYLNKEVLLIVCPVETTRENEFTWFQPICLNFFKDYENELYNINYYDEKIQTYQLTVTTESIHHFRSLISTIYEYNPLYVISMGSYFNWEDVLNQFTTVAVKEMSIHYPISESTILFCNKGVKPEIVQNELDYLVAQDQIPLDYKISVDLDEPKALLQRSQYGIDEDAFVIVVVGNRLDEEITEEFNDFLNKALDQDSRINLAYIGNYSKSTLKDIHQDRVFYLGYQTDLAGAYHVADLFINPPRNGGGLSALLALFHGVPVVTLPECDVASNVGNNFICDSYYDMLHIIERYKNDNEFYKEQQKKGLELTRKKVSEDAGLNEMIEDIVNAVRLKERENL
jgi:glycosyltransferase involved in cell wall biosynthesis